MERSPRWTKCLSFLCLSLASLALLPTDAYIRCPRCREAGNMVECFVSTQSCPGQSPFSVCMGTVSELTITVDCSFSVNCEAQLSVDQINCTAGNRPLQLDDRCHFCCSDLDDCRHKMALVQQGIDGSKEVLHCPTCPYGTTDPYVCLSNLQPCEAGIKMCSVDWEAGTVSAGCVQEETLCRAKEQQTQYACAEETAREDAFCTRCCEKEDCWLKALYITTTPPPSTSTVPPSSNTISASTLLSTTSAPLSTATTTPPRSSIPNCTFTTFPHSTRTTTPLITTTTTVTPPTEAAQTISTALDTTTVTVTKSTMTDTTVTSADSSKTAVSASSSPSATTTTMVTTSRTTATTAKACEDSAMFDCSGSAVCSDHDLATVFCRRTCGLCHGQETPPGFVPACRDHVTRTLHCSHTPDVCQQIHGQILCPVTCGFCECFLTRQISGKETVASRSDLETRKVTL